MNRHVHAAVAAGMALALGGAAVHAAPTLNYQGRVTAGGADFTGEGYFKFVLFNGNDEGLWSNDDSPGTNAPSASVSAEVNNGLFTIELGEGMQPIAPIVLHEPGLQLRTWFSTNNSDFEQLIPDTVIRSTDIARFNTGNTLIVDDDGNADFDDIQEAIDCVASNQGRYCDGILIMPGWYELSAALRFPTNTSLSLRGVGAHEWSAQIHRSGGPAIELGPGINVCLANLTVSGGPAIRHAGESGWFGFHARNCDISLSSEGAEEPAVDLQFAGNGEVGFQECNIQNGECGPAMALGGEVGFRATHCEINNESNAPVIIVTGNALCELESCRVDCREDTHPSLHLDNGSGYSEFKLCDFSSGLIVSNGSANGLFRECRLGRTVGIFAAANAGFSFCGCEFGHEEGFHRVQVVGGNAHVRFCDCYMHGYGRTTLYVEDSTGYIRVEDTELHASDASAVEVIAGPAAPVSNEVSVSFLRCSINAYSETIDDCDAVVVSNHPGNLARDVFSEVSFFGCDVSGEIRDAVRCVGPGCGVEVVNSDEIGGARHGILAADGGEIDVVCSDVYGEGGDGVHLCGSGMLFARAADLWGGEDAYGRGLYLALSNGAAIVVHSTVGSDSGPGLECDSGNALFMNSCFVSGADTMARLVGTNCMVRFNHCVFTSIGEFWGASNPHAALTLAGSGAATPVPTLVACSLEPAAEATNAITLDAGATAAFIMMVNSVLTTNIHSCITNIPSTALDAFGNFVAPRLGAGP